MSKRFSQKHITFIYSTLLDSNRADNKLIKLKLILNKLRTRLLAIARALMKSRTNFHIVYMQHQIDLKKMLVVKPAMSQLGIHALGHIRP